MASTHRTGAKIATLVLPAARTLSTPTAATAPLCSGTCVRTARTARTYHSYDHPATVGPFNSSERAILSAAYQHVPNHGFTPQAISLGAKEAGYPDISASLLPDGAFDLIRYHLVTRREELASRAKTLFEQPSSSDGQSNGKVAGVGAKVERLTWERLMANKHVVHRWQEALAVMAQPSYVPASVKELALLSDEIWFLSGDGSVDPSWYTKRGSLATIYASTELFMTNDRSANYQETREFLKRRLAEVKDVGSVLGSISQWVGFTASAGVNVLRSKGAPI